MIKLATNIVVRAIVYTWLIAMIMAHTHTQSSTFLHGLIAGLIATAFILSVSQFDKLLLIRILHNKIYAAIAFSILVIFWLQLLYEWLSIFEEYHNNESYIYYEGHMFLIGFPSSLFVAFFGALFEPFPESYRTPQHITYVWFLYFSLAIAQYYLLYKHGKKLLPKSKDNNGHSPIDSHG